MEPAFHLAEASDLPAAVQMVRHFHKEEGIKSDEQTVQSALAQLIADPKLGRLWLIRHAGVTAGYVILTLGYSIEFQGRDAFLDELFIVEEHRGQGLGVKALEFVQAAAPGLGVRALHLEVSTTNERAARLYRKMGFVAHERVLMTRWL